MIAINGEVFNYNKPKTSLERKAKAAWEYLDSKHGISKGGYITLKLKDSFKRQVVYVNSMFLEEKKELKYPNSISISRLEKTYIDGDVNNIVCYDTRRKDKDGNWKYNPTSFRVKNDTMFLIKDKDLIVFMYMFSHLVEDSPTNLKINFDSNEVPKFYFEDIKKDVQTRMGKLQRANKVFNLVMELDERDLRRLSATLNIRGFDVDIKESLQEQLINLARDDKKWYDMIIDFTNSHDRVIYDVEEKVSLSIKKKVFGYTKKVNTQKKPFIEWVFKKNGIPLKDVEPVLSYPGDKAKTKTIIDHFVQNPDAYNAFLIRTSEE